MPARFSQFALAASCLLVTAALSVAVTISSDGRYALAWGATLARGEVPDLGPGDLPTPHPGPIALGSVLAGLGPARAADAFAALAAGALVLLLYAIFRLGQRIGGTAMGLVALALAAAHERVWFFGLHAFVDVPFAALVLLGTARAVSPPSRSACTGPSSTADRRRRDLVVLSCLTAAGLLRPEAWPLAVGYAAWAAAGTRRAGHGRGSEGGGTLDGGRAGRVAGGGTTPALFALALAAPTAWLGLDLVLTGDPFHSLTATRALAADLGRARGPNALPSAVGGGLAGLVGWPVAFAGAAVAAWSVTRARRGGATPSRAVVALVLAPLVAGLAGMGAFALAGLPLNDRYLLVPALVLAVLAAAGIAVRGGVPRAALALALAGTGVAVALGPAAVPREVALARSKRVADDNLERSLRSGPVRARLGGCRVVGADGPARAQVSALLERDPASVPIVPRSGPAAGALPDCVVRPPSAPGERGAVLSARSRYAGGGRARPALAAGPEARPAR